MAPRGRLARPIRKPHSRGAASLLPCAMDSITQAALGAAVAEAGLGRRLGNKAILWGAFFGTLPDLDILAYPWLDTVGQLRFHRGISHSILFAVVAGLLFGAGLARLHRIPLRPAAWSVFLVLLTHSLLDCFTVYGTQILQPFSDLPVAWNSIFIIDPAYTLPLLAGLAVALFLNRESAGRRRSNGIGLALSTAYLLATPLLKTAATADLAADLEAKGIRAERFMTAPTPFNTLLWRGVARDATGWWIGYRSLLAREHPIEWTHYPHGPEVPEGFSESRAGSTLEWFSQGFHLVRETEGGLRFHNLRFGEYGTPEAPRFLFAWDVGRDASGEWAFRQAPMELGDRRVELARLFARLRPQSPAPEG